MPIDKDAMLRKMRASKFKQNNAKVLLTINILRHQFEALSDVKYALEKMEESEFLDSINFFMRRELHQAAHHRRAC